MGIINIIKSLAKRTGAFNLLEKFISKTKLGNFLFYLIIQTGAKPKGIKVARQKTVTGNIFRISKSNNVIKISVRHFPYLQDIIQNFDYYFYSVEAQKETNENIVDYSTPQKHILLPSKTVFFFSSFAEPLETTEIYLERGQLKNGDIVLDLGSYCGSTVWGFSKAVGQSGKVYGFEPDPLNYEILCKNINYHNLSNVVTINKGIWSTSGELSFQGEGNMGSGIATVQDRTTNTFPIKVISLNDFCNEYNIDKIDYIKMDIEGAEIEVLKSSGDLLKKLRPRLIIEPHVIGTKLATNKVCEILTNYGYQAEIIPQADLPLPLIYAYIPESE